jgi:predicted Zn-dependent peptidase
MGGTFNVTSGRETITLGGTVLSEFADEYIAVIADVIMHPGLLPADLERLKDDLKRNLSVEKNSPYSIANNAFRNAVFAGHPLAAFLSTEPIINGFTISRVKDFYLRNFGAKRAALYVVGKFDTASTTAAVKAAFSKWIPGPDAPNNKPPDLLTGAPIIVDRPDSKQTYLIIGRPTIPVNDKDYTALYVADALLGGAFGSRITTNIREDKGYSYSPYSSLTNIAGSTSLWMESAEVTSEHAIAALTEVEKEIKKLGEEAPTATELGGVQRYLSGLFVIWNSDPSGIIYQLDFLHRHKLPDSYLTGFVKSINAVTPAQVQAVVKKQLDRSKMTVVLVGDKKDLMQQMESSKPKKAF